MTTLSGQSPSLLRRGLAIRPNGLTDSIVLLLVVTAAVVTLCVDLAFPLGFAGAVPYVLPLVISFAHRRRSVTWAVALGCTLLTFVGWWGSPVGSDVWIVMSNRVLALFAVWVTTFGIQMQRSTSAALRAEHERKQRLLEASPALFVLVRSDGSLAYANPGAEALLGHAASELDGLNWSDTVVDPADRSADRARIERVLQGPADQTYPGQVDLLAVDGSVRHVTMVDSQIVLSDQSIGVLRCGVDATDKVQAQRRLSDQASMARLGEMAALVAHEIKNPLAGIAGGLQIFSSRLPNGADEQRILSAMQDRIKRLDRSIDDLLIFARPQTLHREPVDLAAVTADTLLVLGSHPDLAGASVKVEGHGPCWVSGDEQLLSAALMNLLGNAGEALDVGGQITVRLIPGETEHLLTVSDDGAGMDDAVLAKIFEPFFTTKLRGTGLGLVITRRTVEAHGGTLHVLSEAGAGTEVQVRMPASGAPG